MPTVEMPGTDADLLEALQDANLPTLLMVIVQLTGDASWMSERLAPTPIVAPEGSLFPDDSGDYSAEIAEEIRTAAFDLLTRLRDTQAEVPGPPTLETMTEMMSFSVAEPVSPEYTAMLMEETRFVDRDEQWRKPLAEMLELGPLDDFNVIVVGAGMSGICVAAKLKRAGIIVGAQDFLGRLGAQASGQLGVAECFRVRLRRDSVRRGAVGQENP